MEDCDYDEIKQEAEEYEDFEEYATQVFINTFYPAVTDFLEDEIDRQADFIAPAVEMNDVIWRVMEKDYYEYVDDLRNYLATRINWIKNELS